MPMSPLTIKAIDLICRITDRMEDTFDPPVWPDGKTSAPTGKKEIDNLLDTNHNSVRPYKTVVVGTDINNKPMMYINPRNYESRRDAMRWSEWYLKSRDAGLFNVEALACYDTNNHTYVYKANDFDEEMQKFESYMSEHDSEHEVDDVEPGNTGGVLEADEQVDRESLDNMMDIKRDESALVNDVAKSKSHEDLDR